MEQVIDSAQHKGFEEGRRLSSEIAMLVILTSMSMLFATLMLGYAIYRVSSTEWPPYGFEKVSLIAPSVSTAIIALSSFFYYRFEKSFNKLNYFVSLFFGIGFVVSQFNLWDSLKAQEVYSHSGIFGSMIYGFTWIHLGHIALAFILFLWLIPSVLKMNLTDKIKLKIKNVGKFWHFLGVIWLIMFLTLFVF